MNRERVLFLDDDPERHKTFKRKFEAAQDITYTWTAQECIEAIKNLPRFDIYSLDHDLGGMTFVDVGEENTGTTVAKFIAGFEDKSKYPEVILLHSLNPAGASNMGAILLPTGIRLMRFPFIKY